jgi:hypothetical protein
MELKPFPTGADCNAALEEIGSFMDAEPNQPESGGLDIRSEFEDPMARPRYTGLATFMRAPYRESPDGIDVGLIGCRSTAASPTARAPGMARARSATRAR